MRQHRQSKADRRKDGDEMNVWKPMSEAPKDGKQILYCNSIGVYHVINWPVYNECWDNSDGVWTELPPNPNTENMFT
jgi:hypothetical protein